MAFRDANKKLHSKRSNHGLQSAHARTRWHSRTDMTKTSSNRLTRSFIHSLLLPFSVTPVHHGFTLPCTTIYLSICLPAFLGHWAPPTFIHMPCFVFMLAVWGDGRAEAWAEVHASTTPAVEGAGCSILESLSPIKLNTHTRTHTSLCHSVICLSLLHLQTHSSSKGLKRKSWSKVCCVYLSFDHGCKEPRVSPGKEHWRSWAANSVQPHSTTLPALNT